jgi:flavin-dependent dehydrogenase
VAKAELVVAGAGFAGLCCAGSAALRGVDTVVLEGKADPGQLPHITGLLVKEVADEW